ncbi:hypothetical protein DFH11DRAFT_1501519, partial [Phellopilus nigrolimitatus]
DDIPARVPLNFAPTPSAELQLCTTYKRSTGIGSGRCGSVHTAKSISIRGKTDTLTPTVPPLVLKIAARRRNKSLSRESWFYDKMECLQGSVVCRVPLSRGVTVSLLPSFQKTGNLFPGKMTA